MEQTMRKGNKQLATGKWGTSNEPAGKSNSGKAAINE
jgi:hypothetical protein